MIAFLFMLLMIQADGAPRRMVTVCIADTSGSMDGERLETTKAELIAFAEQAPPSKDHVVVLVPFNSTAGAPNEYTEVGSFKAAVQSLVAGGGSNIADGLHQGRLAAFKYKDAKQLLVMLYTDGEGQDPSRIREEEDALSQLFTSRHAKDLSNHVSLKRWGNANAALRTRLQDNPAVDVTDAESMKILPVAVRPSFKILDVERSKDDPQKVVVEFEAAIATTLKSDAALVVNAICANPGAEGDKQLILDSKKTGQAFRVVIPVSLQQHKAGQFELAYQLAPPKSGLTDSASIFLPLLENKKVSLTVKIPPAEASVFVESELIIAGATRWDDPITGRAIIEAKLKVNRHDDDDGDGAATGILRSAVLPKLGTRIVTGPKEIVIPSSGEQVHTFEFSVPKRVGVEPPVFDLELNVKCRADSPYTNVTPPSHTWKLPDIPAPPPVVVPVTIDVEGALSPLWVRLPDLCVFQAKVKVDVDGRIPLGTTLMLSAPPEVKKVNVSPQELHEGEQMVTLTIWATLPPKPGSSNLVFGTSTQSANNSQIKLSCQDKFELTMSGPQPVTIVNAHGDSSITVADNASEIPIPVNFVLAPGVDPRVAANSKCETTSNGIVGGSQSFGLFSPDFLRIATSKKEKQSIFRSQTEEFVFDVRPQTPSQAILPSQFRWQVTKRPPFVRYFIYFACAIAPVMIVGMVVWLVRKFRTSESLIAGESNNECF